MPSGFALNFNGSYLDTVKALHTMTPAYSRFWRRYPTPAQQAAVQELNEQGLYPTKSTRADFTGGLYPATIELAPTGAPGCGPLYAGSAVDANGCCYGDTPTPMADIVARPPCMACSVPHCTLRSPNVPQERAFPRINRQQAMAWETANRKRPTRYGAPSAY